MSKLTICLNMIVKNESHIIEKTLNNLCDKIQFDYWVISDTGSDDNTCDLITNFFKDKNIPGELHHDVWKDFSHNRNIALEYAYQKTNLLLVFDADDEIIGNPVLPLELSYSGFNMTFMSSDCSYSRILLINNNLIWKYKSVLHEYIYCTEQYFKIGKVDGNYHCISGRSGNRSLNPNKYLNDATVLEKAYYEEKNNNGELRGRYAFYCANSFRDANYVLKSIEWYKITLTEINSGWIQEKYISCLYLYKQYIKLNQIETGIFYLVESYKYDTERVECIYELIKHYCCTNMLEVAMSYYNLIKQNNNIDRQNKLFFENNTHDFYLPYYMIIITERLKNITLGISMYKKIFTIKPKIFQEWFVYNLLHNLQFFLDYIPIDDNNNLIQLANDYIKYLYDNNVPLHKLYVLQKYTKYNIITDYIFSDNKQQCIDSKNILFYTGFSDIKWNYTYVIENAIGGSEKAVAYLSNNLSKTYNIYICGDQKPEQFDNITYIPLNEVHNLVNNTFFNTVIVSRYISFYDMFPQTQYYQSFIWAHDTQVLSYGSSLNATEILTKYNNKINGCICLTEYHKELFNNKYPILNNKINIINNGIICEKFNISPIIPKQKNKFIYSSRPERGLEQLIDLWPELIKNIPDATLVIATYAKFPNNEFESNLAEKIKKYTNIQHLGCLNEHNLYKEMASCEFWLYPCTYPETSCITAFEILMSKVIPIYYPIAGLTCSLNGNGIKTAPGIELVDLLKLINLTDDDKQQLIITGHEYASQCSWNNRAKEWEKLLFK